MKKSLFDLQLMFLTVCFFLFSTIVMASDLSAVSIDRLLKVSGLTKQTSELPGLFKASLEPMMQQNIPLTPDDFREIEIIIGKTVLPEEILTEIRTRLAADLSDLEVQRLLSWYESDLGRKITEAEEKSSTPEAIQATLGQTIEADSDRKRIALVQKIEAIINSADKAMEMQKKTALAFFRVITIAISPFEEVDTKGFEANLDAQNSNMRTQVNELVIKTFLYAFRDFEINDLEKYSAFLERPESVKFTISASEALLQGIDNCLGKMPPLVRVTFKTLKKDQ